MDRGARHHQGNKSTTIPLNSGRFFIDHGAELVAQGDLVGKVRRSFAASQVSLHPSNTRVYFQAPILVLSLRLAKNLRTQLPDTWVQAKSDAILHFRACLATVIPFTFFVAWRVAGEHELSSILKTYCVHQPVESSFTTGRGRDNAALTRSENANVNYKTRLTLT
jgi:hypothetical protein